MAWKISYARVFDVLRACACVNVCVRARLSVCTVSAWAH